MSTDELIAEFRAMGGGVTLCRVEMPLHLRSGRSASIERRQEFRRDKRPRSRQPVKIITRDDIWRNEERASPVSLVD